jgi:hypothetical protein
MEHPKLTSQRAEAIINLLRDNPGVSMSLGMIADEMALPVEDLAVYLEELVSHDLAIKETTTDGFDTYRFPEAFQRGSTAPQ